MKDFKVGDRVRFVGEEGPWFERQIIEGDEGVVVGKGFYDDDLCVRFSMADDVSVGKSEVYIKPWDAPDSEYKKLDMVEGSVTFEGEDEQTDYSKLTSKTYSFSCTIKAQSRKDKILFRWLVFGGRKPRNLKYPHKKRKIRILSKWINRYMYAYNYEK